MPADAAASGAATERRGSIVEHRLHRLRGRRRRSPAPYTTSKFALRGLTKVVALENSAVEGALQHRVPRRGQPRDALGCRGHGRAAPARRRPARSAPRPRSRRGSRRRSCTSPSDESRLCNGVELVLDGGQTAGHGVRPPRLPLRHRPNAERPWPRQSDRAWPSEYGDGRMDLRYTAEQDEFRAEARAWLEANVPSAPLPSFDTEEGFAPTASGSASSTKAAGRRCRGPRSTAGAAPTTSTG